ncbi:NRP2 [Branchiostoma lanceolatum]|uniref:NRP2 protein n=1 Tax=Branchiostoma lanceolatum TaxID=7740 RepID=A0A8J9WDX7_BRALA|nr:NRP2 [Branchiostoma lanceolatum]
MPPALPVAPQPQLPAAVAVQPAVPRPQQLGIPPRNRPSQPGGVNLLIGDANHPGSAIGQLLTSGNLPDGINLVIGPNSGQPAFPGANGGPRKGKQIINNQITVLDSDGGCGGCAGEGAPQIINNQIIAFKGHRPRPAQQPWAGIGRKPIPVPQQPAVGIVPGTKVEELEEILEDLVGRPGVSISEVSSGESTEESTEEEQEEIEEAQEEAEDLQDDVGEGADDILDAVQADNTEAVEDMTEDLAEKVDDLEKVFEEGGIDSDRVVDLQEETMEAIENVQSAMEDGTEEEKEEAAAALVEVVEELEEAEEEAQEQQVVEAAADVVDDTADDILEAVQTDDSSAVEELAETLEEKFEDLTENMEEAGVDNEEVVKLEEDFEEAIDEVKSAMEDGTSEEQEEAAAELVEAAAELKETQEEVQEQQEVEAAAEVVEETQDELTETLDNVDEVLEEGTQEEKEEVAEELAENVDTLFDQIRDADVDSETVERVEEELQEQVDALAEAVRTEDTAAQVEIQETIQETVQEVEEAVEEAQETQETEAAAEDVEETQDELTETLDNVDEVLEEGTQEEKEEVAEELAEDVDTLFEEIKNADVDSETVERVQEELQEQVDALAEAVRTEDTAAQVEIQETIQETVQEVEEAVEEAQETQETEAAAEDVEETQDELTETLDNVDEVLEEGTQEEKEEVAEELAENVDTLFEEIKDADVDSETVVEAQEELQERVDAFEEAVRSGDTAAQVEIQEEIQEAVEEVEEAVEEVQETQAAAEGDETGEESEESEESEEEPEEEEPEEEEPEEEGETVSVIESIPQAAFTASSTLDERHSSFYATIGKTYEDGTAAFWAPATDDVNQYLQLDMGQPTQLSTVETQGAAGRFVSTYYLRYSLDGVTWTTYKGEDGEDMVFTGNSDDSGTQSTKLSRTILCRYLRFSPLTWGSGGIAFRVNTKITSTSSKTFAYYLLNKFQRTENRQFIAVGSALPDSSFTASSNLDDTHTPQFARIGMTMPDGSPGFWAPATDGTDQYLQVDMTEPTTLQGVMVQGALTRFVTKFTVQYSMDGTEFQPVTDDSGEAYVFTGNTDGNAPSIQPAPAEFTCRYIRFFPMEWSPGGIAFRINTLLSTTAAKTFTLLHKTTTQVTEGETVSVIESIPEEAFTASSTLDERHSSFYATIGKTYEDGTAAFWAPATDDVNQYLQLDMGQPTQLSTVETQGAAGRFVSTYYLRYSLDGVTWTTYKGDDGEDMVFTGNSDDSGTQSINLSRTILCRYLRFSPLTWGSGGIGFRVNTKITSKFIAVGSALPDSSFTASSNLDDTHTPQYARIGMTMPDGSPGFWAPATDGTDQYLQVDMTEPTTLQGVMVQGALTRFVTKFTVQYSMDGTEFQPVTDDSGEAYVFTGNTDGNAPSIQPAPAEFTCRYIRFFPMEWSPGGIAFRINILLSTTAARTFTLLHKTTTQVTQRELVSAGRALPDASFTTSSSKDEAHSAHFANLGKIVQDGTAHYWQPATDQAGEYVQVDFTQPLEFGGLVTKGGGTGWLTNIQLKYSMDGEQWTTYDKIITGNTDADSQNVQPLAAPITCRYIQLVTVDGGWSGTGIGFRFDVLITKTSAASFTRLQQAGSSATTTQQRELVSAGRALPDASFTTSSSKDEAHSAHFANLGKIVQDGTAHYWQPATDQAGEYVQVDFTQPLEFGGLVTKGGGTGWLTNIQLKYSMDGEQWTTYDKTITGNTDADGQNVQPLAAPITCRYIQLVTVDGGWGGTGIGLRFDVLITKTSAASFTQLQQAGSATVQHKTITAAMQEKLRAFVSIGNFIPDASFTASSELDADHSAVSGNLGKEVQDGTKLFWAPSTDQAGEYLQIDLTQPIEVRGVATKGGGGRWLTKMKVQHSMDGEAWTDYAEEIAGNTDGEGQNLQPFGEDGFTCRYMRFLTVAGGWSAGGAGLRVSPLVRTAVAKLYVKAMRQHMESSMTSSSSSQAFMSIGNLIPDASFTASSELDADHSAVHGNLGKEVQDGTEHFWAPSTDQAGEYLQFDLIQPIEIRGIATKGRGNRWLTKMKVQHSMDGEAWTDYAEEVTGNTDGEGQNLQPFATGFTCRYLRIMTVAGGWSAGGAGLRASPLVTSAVGKAYLKAMQAHMQSSMTHSSSSSSSQTLDCAKWSEWLAGLMAGPQGSMVPQLAQSCKPVWCKDPAFAEAHAELKEQTCAGGKKREVVEKLRSLLEKIQAKREMENSPHVQKYRAEKKAVAEPVQKRLEKEHNLLDLLQTLIN